MLMTGFIFQVCNEWNEKENIFFYVKYGKIFQKNNNNNLHILYIMNTYIINFI